jgi:hypothetical protein
MQANLAEVPSTSAADGAAAAPVSRAAAAAAAAGAMPAGVAAGNAFVINLVSSTTPVVLTRPDHAGLKRFTFFVSRRREDGRERFRLHMGYFDTQEEAEKLLDIVRTIYPGAWAGLAPGRRLANGGAPAAGPTAATSSADAAAQSAAPASAPSTATPAAPATAVTAAATRAPRAAPRATEAPTLALMPDEGRRQLSDVTLDLEEPVQVRRPAADVPVPTAAGAAPAAAGALPATPPGEGRGEGEPQSERERQAARRSFSNVRDTIAALADSGIRAPVLSEIPELKAAVIPVARPVVRPAQSRQSIDPADLTNTATLRLLESGDPVKTVKMPAVAEESEPQTPQRPRARQGLAPAQSAPAPREEKSWYAVQLMWAVQPIAMAQIPQLAIFSAYTVYGAEGNRDGRRWYGLRLGFFTDAVSAKQVAHYVRGDFATVSVVPVTSRERDHALQAVIRSTPPAKAGAGAAGAAVGHTAHAGVVGAAASGPAARVKSAEFAFIEGTESQITRLRSSPGDAARVSRAAQPPAGGRTAGTALVGGKRPSRGAPGKRAKPRPTGQVHARARAKPRTLEETLEILGAGELQVADSSAGLLSDSNSLLNDSGVPHLKSEAAKAKSSSKLSRLFDRLAERIGN